MTETDYSSMNVKALRDIVRTQGHNGITWNGKSTVSATREQLLRFLKTGEKPGQIASPVPDGMKLEFSIFANKLSSTARRLTLDHQTFIKLFSERDVRADKDGKMFAPATFNKSRSNENFIAASGVCIDFDHGTPTIEQVLELFPGTLAAYYSTHSHTPESPRFRVVIPLSRLVNVDEHTRLILGVKSIIPPMLMECIDETCFQCSRAHYLPSCPPDQACHAFAGSQEGETLDVEWFLSLSSNAVTTGTESILPVSNTFEFLDTDTGEVFNLTAWAVKNPDFDIVAAVDTQYRRGKAKDGKQHIQCPFEDQHSDPGQDLATFIANASPSRRTGWNIHCMHSHCVDRDRLEFLSVMLEKGWLPSDMIQIAAPTEVKRPTKIYYPVDDVAAAMEWTTLGGNEFRVALHLMTIMWSDISGTIDDNNRKISRRLRMPESEWLQYKEILIEDGWLLQESGRLTNRIVKREYDNAVKALAVFLSRCRKGGQMTQEKNRNAKLQSSAG